MGCCTNCGRTRKTEDTLYGEMCKPCINDYVKSGLMPDNGVVDCLEHEEEDEDVETYTHMAAQGPIGCGDY